MDLANMIIFYVPSDNRTADGGGQEGRIAQGLRGVGGLIWN